MAEPLALRVVSYNVHGLRDDTAALTGTVRGLAPDVLIVQEAPRRLRWRTRCAQLARALGLVYAAGGLPSLGNVIMVSHRVRIHHTWHLQFPLTPGRHLRGAVFARASVARTGLVLAGAHLATDPAERPAQAHALARELAGLAEPVVLGVDVNETCGGSAWRTLVDALADTAAGHPAAGTATYPTGDPRDRIDLLLADPRLAVAGYQVVDTATARLASDHLPVVADLLVPAG